MSNLHAVLLRFAEPFMDAKYSKVSSNMPFPRRRMEPDMPAVGSD